MNIEMTVKKEIKDFLSFCEILPHKNKATDVFFELTEEQKRLASLIDENNRVFYNINKRQTGVTTILVDFVLYSLLCGKKIGVLCRAERPGTYFVNKIKDAIKLSGCGATIDGNLRLIYMLKPETNYDLIVSDDIIYNENVTEKLTNLISDKTKVVLMSTSEDDHRIDQNILKIEKFLTSHYNNEFVIDRHEFNSNF
jgi:hypothetical protein